MKPTADQVRELLNYDPETGALTWKRREERSIRDKIFNGRFVGRRAGCFGPYSYGEGSSMNMLLHRGFSWTELTRDGKIAAIKSVYEPGMSASEIAAAIGGITRNAIIGMYGRYASQLKDCELRPYRLSAERPRRNPKRAVRTRRTPTFKAESVYVQAADETHLCGRPIMALGANQCRWPVNDAEAGELHLFCSMPTEGGSYCDHHEMRAYRRPE